MGGDQQYKAVINILGSCISRDIFSYQSNNGGYRISKYSNCYDIFNITGNPVEIDKEVYYQTDFSEMMSNFDKRCLYLDLTKNTLNYIREERSDYLILDSAMCRFSSYKINDAYIAFNPKREKVLNILCEQNVIPEAGGGTIKWTEDNMAGPLKIFADEILKIYAPEQIILLDIQGSFFHDNGSKLEPFSNVEKWKDQNHRIRFAFELLKKYLDGCHIIPMPEAVASDTNHWLKVAVLHFTKEYYNYAYECIEIINKKLPAGEEKALIERLCFECTEFYFKHYYDRLATEFSERNALLQKEKKVKESRDLQAKFFKSMLLKHSAEVSKFFVDHKYKTIILYGWTRISEYIAELSNHSDITVICVMENITGQNIGGHIVKGGFKVIPRNSDIPQADCIIVADIANKESIVKNLHSRTTIPICTDDDLLE